MVRSPLTMLTVKPSMPAGAPRAAFAACSMLDQPELMLVIEAFALFMKLPNGDHAIVEIRKLLECCLDSQHPRGRNKARVFASVGIREADAEELRTALFAAAGGADVEIGAANVYGQRYIVDFDLVRQGRVVRIRSTWIVRAGDDLPRLTSRYVL